MLITHTWFPVLQFIWTINRAGFCKHQLMWVPLNRTDPMHPMSFNIYQQFNASNITLYCSCELYWWWKILSDSCQASFRFSNLSLVCKMQLSVKCISMIYWNMCFLIEWTRLNEISLGIIYIFRCFQAFQLIFQYLLIYFSRMIQ